VCLFYMCVYVCVCVCVCICICVCMCLLSYHVGKDLRQEEEGMTENEMVRWYHRLNGHEFG